MESKICKNCGIKFFRKESQTDKSWILTQHCSRECKNKFANNVRKKWRKENPEEYKQQGRDWRKYEESNPELLKRRNESIKRFGQTIRGRYIHYKSGAKQRGLEFSLTLEQFELFWKKPCYYCGGEIETIGLDRVDNNIGYTMDNIVPCCITCNNMKRDLTQEKFISQCKQISNVT